jgi:perosamine synthetase
MIPLFKPFFPKLYNINKLLQSGRLAYGKYGNEFEQLLKEFVGNDFLITCNNFNLAIYIALKTLGIKPGDTVITSPLLCLASAQPLKTYGLNLIFAEVNFQNGAVSLKSIEKILDLHKPKAIYLSYYAGIPFNVNEIIHLLKNKNIRIIEDALDSFGTIVESKYVGNTGADATIFSFNPVRMPSTVSGAAVSFRLLSDFEYSKLVRDSGINRIRFRNEYNEIDPLVDIDVEGYSATMDELSSYIGVQQMIWLNTNLLRIKSNAHEIDQLISNYRSVKMLTYTYGQSNYWIYPLFTKYKKDFIELSSKIGIEVSSVHSNISNYSIFNSELIQTADEFLSEFIAIPVGWWVDMKEYIPKLKVIFDKLESMSR